MSYDVEVIIGTPPETCTYIDCGNYTGNVSRMWRHAGIDLRDFHEKPTVDAVRPLTVAIQIMEDDPNTFKAMEPENKWGNFEGAVQYLKNIRDAIRNAGEQPAILYVSC